MGKNNKYTPEMLAPIVKRCVTWADVARAVGVKPITGAQAHIKSRAVKFGIDFSHFVGKSVIKGRLSPQKKPIEHYLIEGGTSKSNMLRRRLVKEGLKEHRCERCGVTEWMGEPVPLELDHINGVHDDNRFENLQILCPNCHAQKGPVAKR